MAVSETPRHKFKKYSAGTDPHPGRAVHNSEVDKLEQLPAVLQGSTGSRPLSGVGKVLYWDEAVKRFVYDDGSDWQDVAPIGGVTPTGVAVAGAANEGTSPRAARADHTHPLPLASASASGAMSAADKAKLDSSTATATADTIIRRDGTGRASITIPSASSNIANKEYVDNGLSGKSGTGHAHVSATTSAPGFMSAADKAKLDIITTIGPWESLTPTSWTQASAYTPQYRVNSGRMELRGAVIRGTAGGQIAAGIPQSLRPAQELPLLLKYTSGLTVSESQIMTATGYLKGSGVWISTTPQEGMFIFLDGISWAV